MCFGDSQQSTSTTTPTPNAAVASAANTNLNYATGMLGTPNTTYGTQYGGQLVASLDPSQQATINSATGIANNGTGATASNLINNYASAPAQSVTSNSIASNMSPYMNQYVMQALAPQLQQMDVANAKTNQATDAAATGSGAYGDARTGIEQSTNAFNQNVAREGVIGNAYNAAFNTAIGAGAQDSANQLTAGTTNANLNETALSRQLSGATADEGLQTQQLGAQTTANSLTQQDTAQQQANLTAQYNNWLQAQQSGVTASAAGDAAVSSAAQAEPASTSTVSETPDNSGYALLGAAIGTAGKLAVSDRRLKEDIEEIGKMHDGTPIYSYAYKFDPAKNTYIGPMAQDVQKRNPDAVVTLKDGTMLVDYSKATALSRALAA